MFGNNPKLMHIYASKLANRQYWRSRGRVQDGRSTLTGKTQPLFYAEDTGGSDGEIRMPFNCAW